MEFNDVVGKRLTLLLYLDCTFNSCIGLFVTRWWAMWPKEEGGSKGKHATVHDRSVCSLLDEPSIPQVHINI